MIWSAAVTSREPAPLLRSSASFLCPLNSLFSRNLFTGRHVLNSSHGSWRFGSHSILGTSLCRLGIANLPIFHLSNLTDGMADWLTRSALRVQTCIAMLTLSRAGDLGFDSRDRLLQGRFLWFPFFSGECRSRHQVIAYRSLVPKPPQHRPVGLSRGAAGGKHTHTNHNFHLMNEPRC